MLGFPLPGLSRLGNQDGAPRCGVPLNRKLAIGWIQKICK
jgi:hypothetical protein